MAVAIMGEKVAKALETTFDMFMIIIRDLKTMIMDAIMNLLQVEVVQAGIKWLLLGIGDLNKQVQEIIHKVTDPINKAIQWLLQKGYEYWKKFLDKILGRKENPEHLQNAGTIVASQPEPVKEKIIRWRKLDKSKGYHNRGFYLMKRISCFQRSIKTQ